MALDLVKRRAIRAAERLLPGADLKAVLADPFMMEVHVLLSVALAPCQPVSHSMCCAYCHIPPASCLTWFQSAKNLRHVTWAYAVTPRLRPRVPQSASTYCVVLTMPLSANLRPTHHVACWRPHSVAVAGDWRRRQAR